MAGYQLQDEYSNDFAKIEDKIWKLIEQCWLYRTYGARIFMYLSLFVDNPLVSGHRGLLVVAYSCRYLFCTIICTNSSHSVFGQSVFLEIKSLSGSKLSCLSAL